METIDIRDNFPVMNGGDGIILSKRGDICVGWEVLLPPAFRCNEEKYDSLIASLGGAIALLPDYTIIHKQDVFMRKRYSSERVSGFLEKAYEEHFDGREYLDHRCFLWLSFSSKKNVRGGSSGLLGLAAVGLPSASQIGRMVTAAEQFGAMLSGNSLLSLLKEDVLYLLVSLHNRSVVSYEPSSPRFAVESRKRTRRGLEYEKAVFPRQTYGLKTVPPGGAGRFVFTFDKLSLVQGQVLRIYFYEKDGSRNLVMVMGMEDISKARRM